MTPEEQRFQLINEWFDAALERPPEIRRQFVGQACPLELQSELVSLLEIQRDFQTATTDNLGEASAECAKELAGSRIGPYLLERELGRGGMGAVYLGRRADQQYEGKAAVKLLQRGNAGPDLVRRFLAERQILAGLDHPNIARLLDGGATETGQPYFVLEYVEGLPIDVYCREHSLSIVARVELFCQICAAVQYAHQKFVVHRDLKPANILVTPQGVPKLLDFGIAKLQTQARLATEEAETGLTRTGMLLMTPEYAAPEQARGEPVSAATDVYGLGVVLYQLLTGRLPHVVKGHSLAEILRTICEQEPPRPSTVVEDLRQRRELAGDLEAIVLKALRKEPLARYASAGAFHDDLRCYLESRPVAARQGNLQYRAAKFARRHRGMVLAASLFVGALIAGMITTTWQTRVARQERAKAEQRFNDVRQLANSFLFEFHDAIVNLPGSTPARHLVVKKALDYLSRLSAEAARDPELQLELAEAYLKVGGVQGNIYQANLGDSAGAMDSYRKALAILERAANERRRDPRIAGSLAQAHRLIGEMAQQTSNYQLSIASFQKAVEIGPDNADKVISQYRLGEALQRAGDTAKGMEILQGAVRSGERLVTAEPRNNALRRTLAVAYEKSGNAFGARGNLQPALEQYRKGIAILEELNRIAPGNARWQMDLSVTCLDLADVLGRLGDTEARLEMMRKALTLQETALNADPRNVLAKLMVANNLVSLGTDLRDTGDLAGAVKVVLRSQQLYEETLAVDPSDRWRRFNLTYSFIQLGYFLHDLGDWRKALEYSRRAQKGREELLAADPDDKSVQTELASSYTVTGDVLKTLGDWQEALVEFQKSEQIRTRLLAADPNNLEFQRNLTFSHTRLAEVLVELGRIADARGYAQRAIKLQAELAAAQPQQVMAKFDLAAGHSAMGKVFARESKHREASRAFRTAMRLCEESYRSRPKNLDYMVELAYSHFQTGVQELKLGNRQEASANYQRALELQRNVTAISPANANWQLTLAKYWKNLGELQQEMGNEQEACGALAKSAAVLLPLQANSKVPKPEAILPQEVLRLQARCPAAR